MASRSTSATEKKYPQLDLEALAVDFGLRRFRPYLIGNPEVTVHTDHKPLTSVFRDTRLGSIRTDRIKLRHQDIQYQVKHLNGSDNPADYLSRYPTPWHKLDAKIQDEADECEKLLYHIHTQDILPKLGPEQFTEASMKCAEMTALRTQIQQGVPPKDWAKLRPYKTVFHELTVLTLGNILRGERLVVPVSLRPKLLALGHGSAHLGIVSLKRRLQVGFWYPRLDRDAENFVEQCEKCQLFVPEGVRVRPRIHEIPKRPWCTVSVDLFGPIPKGSHVVVARCNSSRYPVAVIVRRPSAGLVIGALRAIFSEFGFPRNLRSDNAAIFHSSEFNQFLESGGIRHTFSPPYHPRSNPAECAMKLIGKAIKTSDQTVSGMEQAISEALDDYRRTPHPATGYTPIELMKGVLTPQQVARAVDQDRNAKMKRASAYKTPSKNMRLMPGQKVRVKQLPQQSKFKPIYSEDTAVIQGRIHGDTYALKFPTTGVVMQRHRDHIKPIKPTPSQRPQDEAREPPVVIVQPQKLRPNWQGSGSTHQSISESQSQGHPPESLTDVEWNEAEQEEEYQPPPNFKRYPPHRPHTRSQGPPDLPQDCP